jgi:hypothetical protein
MTNVPNINPLEDAIKMSMSFYSAFGSDYSVTQLIDTPRVVQLLKRHGHKIEVNVDNSVSAFIGNGVHAHIEYCLKRVFDQKKDPKYQLERRIFDKILGRKISGQFDILYELKHMFDIKSTSVWKVVFDPDFDHWTKQQNFYAYMLRRDGHTIESINIMALFLDWKKMNAQRDKDYPQSKQVTYPLDLWSFKKQEQVFMERLRLHIAAEKLSDKDLPDCTPEERWESPTKYAVMKKPTAARATKVFDTQAEADKYINDSKAKAKKGEWDDGCVEVRIGERKRCESWCPVNQFCSSYINYIFAQRERLKMKYDGKKGGVINGQV